MENLIKQTLEQQGKTVEWLIAVIGTQTPLSLQKHIEGKNPAYPITLKEAVAIANALDTDIFTLWPELPKPKKITLNLRGTRWDGGEWLNASNVLHEGQVSVSHLCYPDTSAEVDRRLAEETSNNKTENK